jgi:hypothetical protein
MWWGMTVVALAGCGRIAFDARSDAAAPGDSSTMTVTFGENPTDMYRGVTEDTELSSLLPANNDGGDDTVAAGLNATLLLRFDVSALTASAPRVVAATLHLMGDDGSLTNVTMTVHRLREAWTEGAQDNAAGIANWTERTSTASWSAAGAAPPSRDASAMGTFTYQTFMPETVSLEVATVQEWIDTPATNFGIAITATTVGGTMISSEGNGVRPQLELVISD